MRQRLFAFSLLISGTLGACNRQPSSITLNPNDVVQETDLINALDNLANNIGIYNITKTVPSGACNTHIIAYIGQVDLEYKVATNVTVGATAAGNIPIGPFILTPSVNGAYSTIKTQIFTKQFKFTEKDLTVHHSVSVQGTTTAGGSVTVASTPDDQFETIRNALTQDIEVYLDRDHTQHPCITPGDSTLSSALQVEKKLGGGLTLNFLVAQLGGTATSTNDWTQTVKFTFKFDKSSALL